MFSLILFTVQLQRKYGPRFFQSLEKPDEHFGDLRDCLKNLIQVSANFSELIYLGIIVKFGF